MDLAKVKRLWLVGESLLLKEDGTERKAYKTTNLPATLVPLDPRHGVFPNLVMKPLFAAGYALSLGLAGQLLPFFEELKGILSDDSNRRFNVFKNRATKSKGRSNRISGKRAGADVFEIDATSLPARIASFDSERDLWLVFGHQTNFGLLWWLVDSEAALKTDREGIKDFSERFFAAVVASSSTYRVARASQLSSRIGLLHRLCTGADTEAVLEDTITLLAPKTSLSVEHISRLLRATVPLLHNEGYQDGTNPTGNAQSHFVRHAMGKAARGDLYWQVMGHAVATRVLGEFIE